MSLNLKLHVLCQGCVLMLPGGQSGLESGLQESVLHRQATVPLEGTGETQGMLVKLHDHERASTAQTHAGHLALN